MKTGENADEAISNSVGEVIRRLRMAQADSEIKTETVVNNT